MDVISACFVQGEGKRGSLQNNVNLQGSQSFHLGSISKSIFCLAGQKTWLDYSPGGLGLGLHAPEISRGIPKKPPERTAASICKRQKKRVAEPKHTWKFAKDDLWGAPTFSCARQVYMDEKKPACLSDVMNIWDHTAAGTELLLLLSLFYRKGENPNT